MVYTILPIIIIIIIMITPIITSIIITIIKVARNKLIYINARSAHVMVYAILPIIITDSDSQLLIFIV